MLRCGDDSSFGPVLTHAPGCYSFDFTLAFEDSILSIAPCSIALILAAARLYHVSLPSRQGGPLVKWPLLRAAKLAAFAALAALQLTVVVLLGTHRGFRVHTTIASAVLSLVSTLALAAVGDAEHVRSLRPSLLVQSFFAISILLDLPRVRTQWFLPGNTTVAAVYTAAFGLKMAVATLESLHKFGHSTWAGKPVSPEVYQGLFGSTLFTWLNPLFFKGYRNDLGMDDLWEVDRDLTGEVLHARLSKNWKRANYKNKHCFTQAILATFFPELVLASIPRLALIGFNLAQAYLVGAAIVFISDRDLPSSYGYGLIGGYALCYLGVALTTRWYTHITFRSMAKLRGALVTTIFRNMLRVRAETGNSSAALSLMSTDVDRITFTLVSVSDIVPSLLQFAIVIGILGAQLGASCIAPIVVCLLCGMAAAYIAKLMPTRQRRWMAAIQKRVGITSDIVGSMKGVKVAGLSEKAETQIAALRDYELERSTAYRKTQSMTILLAVSPSILMPAVTFTVYAIVQQVSGNDQFGVAKAFTSLSMLNVLISPVMTLTTAWTNMASSVACFDRIQAFLLQEKREDYRLLVSPSSRAGSSSTLPTPSTEAALDKANAAEQPWIRVRGASFGWKKAKKEADKGRSQEGPEEGPEAVLKDVDLDIMPGELTIVIGPVASGKSTLLKALLGEARLISGSVEYTVPEEVAYCDQDAWLLNRSIKENILAFEPYNEAFYRQVLSACQLQVDLDQFEKRDETIIGSQGVSLSGGQKQRVALARAVYNKKPIVILDDIFKGLDADTYHKCFSATLGRGGLLRRNRTAIVIATHNIQLLPQADHIVVLTEDGRISQRGSFDHLNSVDGYISELGLNKTGMEEAALRDAAAMEAEEKAKEAMVERIASQKALQSSEKSLKGRPNMPAGAPSRGKRNADAMVSYLRSLGGVYLVVFCFLTVCSVGARSGQSLWLNEWTSNNEKHPNGRVGYYVGIYVLFAALNVLFMSFEFWVFMVIIVPKSAKTMHNKILVAAMHAPLSYFVATDTGEIVNRFSQDMTLVDMPLPMSFMLTYGQVVGAVAQIILTCIASGYLAIAIPVLLGALFVVQRFYLRTSRQMRLLDLEAKSPLYSDFIASFSGLTALRAYGWTGRSEKENLRRLNASQKPFYMLYCLQRWLALVLNLIMTGFAVFIVGLAVGLRHHISPGLLGVALSNVMGIGQTLSMVIQMWTQLETSLGAVTRINQFAAETPREPDGPDLPPAQWPSQGAVTVRGLSAQYGDRVVLQDISLDIRPAEKVAICGRSGSGKSTFISLLLRLYAPTAGSIVIDGIDTGRLRLNALREAVVALPQDPMFLAGSVRYNLDPLEKAADEDLLEALERTNMSAVIKEKGGLDADLNTDWLSAGQRQLFCLARAMIRKSKVLLLDEATSSLDRQTEAIVDELVRTAFADWTVIVVAHRLRTVADFDKVVVLQEGRIVEVGSPQELLDRESIFKSLWDLQGTEG